MKSCSDRVCEHPLFYKRQASLLRPRVSLALVKISPRRYPFVLTLMRDMV